MEEHTQSAMTRHGEGDVGAQLQPEQPTDASMRDAALPSSDCEDDASSVAEMRAKRPSTM